jgi:prepilin-type processing-associated H-X9-DG protein
MDIPASYHGNAGGFSFADGHSEIHRWIDGSTCKPIKPDGVIFNGQIPIPSPGNKDIPWMQDKTTRPKQ